MEVKVVIIEGERSEVDALLRQMFGAPATVTPLHAVNRYTDRLDMTVWEPVEELVQAWGDERIGLALTFMTKEQEAHRCICTSWDRTDTGIRLYCEHGHRTARQWVKKVCRKRESA